MTIEVHLHTLNSGLAPKPLTLFSTPGPEGPTWVEVQIPWEVAGRDVSEPYLSADLQRVAEVDGTVLNDALGLIFARQGDVILVTVSAGSGNERFHLHPADLLAGLDQLRAEV